MAARKRRKKATRKRTRKSDALAPHKPRVDLRVGGEYFVDFPSEAEGQLDGVIVRLEQEKTLAYVWGVTVVEWTITPSETGCSYTFIHYGQPPGMVDQEEGIAAGWHAWYDDLDTHLEGRVPEYGEKARWEKLMPAYRARIAKVLN